MFKITDIKGGLAPVVRKLTTVTPQADGTFEELTPLELAALIFAFESNIVFNGVSQMYVPLLKNIQQQEGTKIEQIRSIFVSALQAHIYHDIKVRFGA